MYLGIDKRGTISIQGDDRNMVQKIEINEGTANILLRDDKWEQNRERMKEFLFTNFKDGIQSTDNVLQDTSN